MIEYVAAQLVSVAAIIAVTALALWRYKVRTDAALKAALAGMDRTTKAALDQMLKQVSHPDLPNGHPTPESPTVTAAG